MSRRVLYLSRIKAVACIAVVVLHTFYAADSYAASAAAHSAMLSVRNCMMWAVPCFVMASGALLLDKKRELDLKKLFGKYILRMVIALLVFSVLFGIFDSVLLPRNGADPSVIGGILGGLETALYGNGWAHMWYIYMMIAIYLLLPAYKLVTRSAKPADLRYLLFIYLIFMSVLPLVTTLWGKTLPFYICVFTIYPFYLFLGYALHTGAVKLPRLAGGAVFLLSTVITVILTIYSTDNSSEKLTSLLGNYSFPVIVAGAAGAYSFFRAGSPDKLSLFDKIAGEIDKCSFGIYLIHMAVLKYIFAVLRLDPFDNGGAVTVLAICIAAFLISYTITRVLKFIPYLNRII